jgi:predicted dehydrogenase
VHLLGPIARATGFAQCRNPDRIRKNTKNPDFGEKFNIGEIINAITGSLELKNGILANLTVVSEGFGETPRLEIYGTEGTLICPDPNTFGGPVLLRRNGPNPWGDKEFFPIPLTHGFSDACYRGIGAADMAWSIVNNRTARCEDIGFHVFEVIHGIWEGTKTGKIHVMESACAQPAPLASGYIGEGYDEYALTL